MKNFFVCLVLSSCLFSCSSSREENASSDEQHKQLYNAVNQPLEQAKSVEKQVLDSAEQRKKQADDL